MTPTEVAAILRQFNQWRRTDDRYGLPYPDPREIGVAIDAAIAMIDRLEAAESDALEQARLNGMGSEREAALMAKLEVAENERDALQAKIEAMEQQEPYLYIYEYSNPIDGSPVWRDKPGYWNAQFPKSSKPLYLAPGAQPAPSFADAYQGAMEDVVIWKKRALEAEDLNRKFVAEINGPAYMGEPAQPAPTRNNPSHIHQGGAGSDQGESNQQQVAAA